LRTNLTMTNHLDPRVHRVRVIVAGVGGRVHGRDGDLMCVEVPAEAAEMLAPFSPNYVGRTNHRLFFDVDLRRVAPVVGREVRFGMLLSA